jgi:ComF family protein
VSVVRYGPPVSGLLHSLKYGANTTVLPALCTILKPFLDFAPSDCNYIVPVPLHFGRLRLRGLNQAVYLSQLIFPDNQAAIIPDLLQRKRATRPQTGLDGAGRRRNLRGAFALRPGSTVLGKSVCLVDDVFTTGTTLYECGRVLRAAGAAEIRAVTLARVVLGD